MSLSFVSHNGTPTTPVSTSTTLTVDVPTTNVGDLLLVWMRVAGSGIYGSATPPAGWSEVAPPVQTVDSGVDTQSYLFSHQIAAGDPSSVTFTLTNATGASGLKITQFRSTLGLASVYTAASAAGFDSPVVDTVGPGQWLVIASVDAPADTPTIPSGAVWPSTGDHELMVFEPASVVGSQSAYTVQSGPNNAAIFSVVLSDYEAPYAPVLTTPTNGLFEDLSGTPTWAWTYEPADGTTQAAWALRMKIAGASSYSYWNVSTGAWQSTVVWNTGSSSSYTFPAGAWANGNTYNWSAATESSGGLQGPFASDFTVTGQAPATVTVTAPSGTITSTEATVSWTASFPAGAAQIAYRVLVYTYAEASASGFYVGQPGAIYDSGTVPSTATSDLATGLPNSAFLAFYVQVTETGGEVTTAPTVAPTSFTTAAAPTVTAAPSTASTGQPVIEVTVTAHDNALSTSDSGQAAGPGTWTATGASVTPVVLTGAPSPEGLEVVTTGTSAALSCATNAYAATPGEDCTGAVEMIAAAAGQSGAATITFYDAGGTQLGTTTVGTSEALSTTAYTAASVEAIAPATTAYFVLGISLTSTATGFTTTIGPRWLGTTNAWGNPEAMITRSDAETVRFTPAPIPWQSGVVSIDDGEAVPGVAYTYTASISSTVGGSPVVSPSATSSAVTLTTADWWIVDPTNPAGAVKALVTSLVTTQMRQAAAHQTQGQKFAVIVADSAPTNGRDGAIAFETFDDASHAALVALINAGRVVFISSPTGEAYFGLMGPAPGAMAGGTGQKLHDVTLLPSAPGTPHRTLAATWNEQARPAT